MPRVKAPKESKQKRLSPGRLQYLHFKQKYPDSLLLFRMGDFYETFDDDARTMARVLDITLTARDVGGGARSPLAGIPHHALDGYLGKLVSAGLKVAVAEQVSDPATTKGIVDRAVVRVITPGTVQEPNLLTQDRNNYLAAAVSDGVTVGLAYIDISTSEFITSQLPLIDLKSEVDRLGPAELLVDSASKESLDAGDESGSRPKLVTRDLDESRMAIDLAEEHLKKHFKSATVEAFGCAGKPLAILAASAVLEFLGETQLGAMPQVTSLRTLEPQAFMQLDRRALRDLEVFEPTNTRSDAPTLFSTLNHTSTPMGARMLRGWLARPLMDLDDLTHRQDAIAGFVEDGTKRAKVREALKGISDLERLLNRARTFTASPRDISAIGRSLSRVPAILDLIGQPSNGLRSTPFAGLRPCEDVTSLVSVAIADDPPVTVGDGNAIREGFDAPLDEVRTLSTDARGAIAAIETRAREATGIKSLKIGYNKVFGYYIEVSRTNLDRVPEEFERRQTLTNGERYITPELKELESKVLNARESISELERDIFRRVCGEVAAHGERIMQTAQAIAWLDSICGMAEAAALKGWKRPVVNDGDAIRIKEGRHPVVEAALGSGKFVPNDIDLSSGGQQVAIITGPNMSGKSTYIRQVAVLALLAQTGSFIPAVEAELGITDRIFTRAGLSDDIAGGQSTFMVEMVETASILNQATSRSLAVLDEIGRGTSTYDGLAIARAVAEHIHNDPRLGCKTLFATHYHEMTALADELPRAVNYRVAVSEDGHDVVFLHRIVPGGADRSYGVHVARLAGMPQPVVARAWDLLEELEKGDSKPVRLRAAKPQPQLSLFDANSPALDELKGLKVDEMTPLDALNTLYRLQKMSRGEE